MTDGADYRLMLSSARDALLEGNGFARPGVPDNVAASWRRSLTSGVSPTLLKSQYVTELDLASRLVRCAQPVIDQLNEQLADVPLCVALTDNKARIVARKDSTQWISRILDRVYFAQGFDYAEGSVGTNGVGTVLEFGASVQIVGAEHFVDSLQAFACVGAPVRDPFTGRIEGVLDITCLQDHYTPIMHSLVRSAAKQVERNLILDRNQAQQALFDVYTRVDSRTREAVLAAGPRMTVTNTAMETLLSASDQAALTNHMRFLMGHRPFRVDDRVDLPSGIQVRVRGSTTEFGDDVAGMVAVVTRFPDIAVRGEAFASHISMPPGSSHESAGTAVRESSSPAWCAAALRVEQAMRAGQPILALGEPGSGRFTLLSDMYRHLNSNPRVVALDASEVNAAPHAAAALLVGQPSVPTLIVLRDLDRLTADAGSALLEAIGKQPGPMAYLTATATPSGTRRDQPLLLMFEESATVPPLRHRTIDLPRLARSILEDLGPNSRARLSEEVFRLLSRHRWPGNVLELREVIASALSRRPVGTIEPDDLPAYCQSAPRSTLREVDKVERDVIVAALREEGGNRKAAAVALGIARSTLYRKIRQYGVTG